MHTVIYADVLVIVNLIVNYFLLRAAAALTGGGGRVLRQLGAAALGGVYALVIFLDRLPAWVFVPMELAFAAVMVLSAFGYGARRLYLKRCAAFLLANGFFAGAMLAVRVLFSPHGLIQRNGVTYVELDLLTLTLLSVGCYAVLTLLGRFLRSGRPPRTVYAVSIRVGERTVSGKALLDTGSTLRDGFSAKPVLLAERDFVRPLLPASGDLSEMRGFRCVPFSSVGGSGLLRAFTADAVTLDVGDRGMTVLRPTVAVTDRRLIAGGYAALFGPAFLEEGMHETRRKGVGKHVKKDAQSMDAAAREDPRAAVCRRD